MCDAGGRGRSFRSCSFAIALAVCGALGGASAQAQEGESAQTEARALFEAGRTAFDAGRFESALESFRRAYALSARPELDLRQNQRLFARPSREWNGARRRGETR